MKFFLGRALFRYNEGTFYNYQIVDCNVGLLTFVYLPSVRLCMQYWGIQTGGPGQPYSAAKWHGRAWCATHTGMILSLSFDVKSFREKTDKRLEAKKFKYSTTTSVDRSNKL